ncbi:TPA: fimbrial protein [Escherichia coli]
MKRLHKRFLLATFCALFTATLQAADVTITVNGRVVAKPCTTGYYKNEGTAENIQIELRDDQDAALKNGDSKTVIVDEITRNAQFPLKARAITVNGNASQGTIEALINVIYTWQ